MVDSRTVGRNIRGNNVTDRLRGSEQAQSLERQHNPSWSQVSTDGSVRSSVIEIALSIAERFTIRPVPKLKQNWMAEIIATSADVSCKFQTLVAICHANLAPYAPVVSYQSTAGRGKFCPPASPPPLFPTLCSPPEEISRLMYHQQIITGLAFFHCTRRQLFIWANF